MKKDEKIEKILEGMSEEKNSPESKKRKIEQSTLPSSNNDRNLLLRIFKKNHNFVRISGKQICLRLFNVGDRGCRFCLFVRDQVKTILPNALVEYFAAGPK